MSLMDGKVILNLSNQSVQVGQQKYDHECVNITSGKREWKVWMRLEVSKKQRWILKIGFD